MLARYCAGFRTPATTSYHVLRRPAFEGFRTPATTSYHVLRRPAFEKRQGTKSREVRSVGRAAGSAMGI